MGRLGAIAPYGLSGMGCAAPYAGCSAAGSLGRSFALIWGSRRVPVEISSKLSRFRFPRWSERFEKCMSAMMMSCENSQCTHLSLALSRKTCALASVLALPLLAAACQSLQSRLDCDGLISILKARREIHTYRSYLTANVPLQSLRKYGRAR